MKKELITIIALFVFHCSLFTQNVGINTTTPATSAALDITATDKGLLVPRMTTTQRTAIASPATGLLVYDNTLGQFYFYSGSAWTVIPLSSSSGVGYVGTSYLGQTSGAGSTGASEGTSSNLYNIGIGTSVLNANTTGNNNIGLGQNALKANTTISDNIAIGQGTLQNAEAYTAGFDYFGYNYPSIAIGKNALNAVTTPNNSIAIGYEALKSNQEGLSNIAIGNFAQKKANNSSNENNVSLGNYTLFNQTNGSANTAIGTAALYNNTTGYNNTAIGHQTGTNASGFTSGANMTTGNYNTFLGYGASASGNSFSNTTAIGAFAVAGASNTMVLGGTGIYAVNVGIGTTTPSEKLEVSGKTKTTNFQMTNGATNGYVLQSDASGNGTWATLASASVVAGNGLSYSGSTLNSVWTSANGGIIYNNTGSKTGINTTSPYCMLANTSTNIYGADGQGLNLNSLGWSQNSTGYTGAFFNSSTNVGAQGLAVKIAGTSSTNRLLDLSTDVQSDYAGTSVMVVQGDGKVGIGTASPSYKLDIQGAGTMVSNLQSSTGSAYLSSTSLAATESAVKFNTYISSSSAPSRWIMGKGSSSESGSNGGGDFFINRYNDAGLYNGQPLSISRANGTITVGNDGVSTSENTLKVNGSMAVKVTAITSSNNATSLVGSDYMVVYSGTSSGNSITLPSASNYTGRIYMLVNHSSSSVGVSTYYTANATTSTSIAIGTTTQLVSDGSNWHKIN
jgi:trimeric autotransporter adhesin